MEKEVASLFKTGKEVEAARLMEDLLAYSLEIGGFDEVASLEIIVIYIDQLIVWGLRAVASDLLGKVAKVSRNGKQAYNQAEVEVYHQLPVLFNRAKQHWEAIETAKEAIQRETHFFGKDNDMALSSMGELARALYWEGQRKEA